MPSEMTWIAVIMIVASIAFIVALVLPEKPIDYCSTKSNRRPR